MKKDVYPDVRIEIISEGLTKKILGKTKDAAPVVYGEEKPKGENLPNIDSKGKNKEMGGLLQVTNKKPTYTSIVKEAIQELRKDNHDKPKIGIGANPSYSIEYQDIGSREIAPSRTVSINPNTKDEQKFEGERMPDRPDAVQDYKGDTQRLLTEGGFGRGISQDVKDKTPYMLPVIAAGKVRDKQMGSTLTPEQKKKGAASIGSGRLEEAMVKEAIFELRKDNGQGQYGDFSPGAPKTTAYQRAEAAGYYDKFKPTTERVTGPEAYRSETLGYVPFPVNREREVPAEGTAATGAFDTGTPSEAIGRTGGSVKRYNRPLPVSEYTEDMMEYPTTPTTSSSMPVSTPEGPKGFATQDIDYGVGATATGAGMKENESKVEMPEPMPEPGPGSDGDKGPPQPPPGGPISDSGASAKKIEDELKLGPRANPEITRPTNPKNPDKLLPKFGSSGYFSAIVDLGEGKNKDFYGVEDITEFLSLYTQNSPAGQFKQPEGDLTTLFAGPQTEKAYIKKAVSKNPFKTSLKKQSPPMAMTMNRPPNMGVGQQQPVITGAGTMKADVAANKPKAAPARTKAPRRAAGSIEQRKEKAYIARQAQKALIKSGMVWDSINKQWVPTRG